MPKLEKPKMINPYKGEYRVSETNNLTKVISTHQITSESEFKTLLEEVFKYNNANPDNPRILLKDN